MCGWCNERGERGGDASCTGGVGSGARPASMTSSSPPPPRLLPCVLKQPVAQPAEQQRCPPLFRRVKRRASAKKLSPKARAFSRNVLHSPAVRPKNMARSLGRTGGRPRSTRPPNWRGRRPRPAMQPLLRVGRRTLPRRHAHPPFHSRCAPARCAPVADRRCGGGRRCPCRPHPSIHLPASSRP